MISSSFTADQDFDAETYGDGSKCFNHADQWKLGINIGPLLDSGCYKVYSIIYNPY